MTRYRNSFLVSTILSLGLFAVIPARAASVTQVSRSTWGASGVPNYVNMYIYVPDKLAANPPVVVACHSCGTPVSGYVNSISGIKAAADKNGFIIILPEATGQNCWDVGSKKSLTHDGGGDTQAVAQMVKYVLTKYSGDAARVYAMGGSSGAMMTQALMAVYPDIFKAGSARAGVAAGCWSDGYDTSNQWSNNCAGGRTTKTAQQWGDLVRGMNQGYSGPRRRIQLFHGNADATINFNNLGESVKEWTNVLGLSDMPTTSDSVTTSVATYKRRLWKNTCDFTVLEAWEGQNGSHSMAYETDAILSFFGLDKAGGADPEQPCSGNGGSGGAGGTAGASSGGVGGNAGGASTAGGTSGGGALGGGGASSGGTAQAGRGGTSSAGASNSMGGVNASGGVVNSGGASSTQAGGMNSSNSGGLPAGGMSGTGGNPNATGGASPGGHPSGASGQATGGAATASGGASNPSQSDDGCSVTGPTPKTNSVLSSAFALGLAVAGLRRRRQRGSHRI
ncbi:MAG TPA: PHB depolymerase family esterase [Polyangiaceae bacterium]|nr:PHB depolymerase family esterase [Polyangiaceae bacterium]